MSDNSEKDQTQHFLRFDLVPKCCKCYQQNTLVGDEVLKQSNAHQSNPSLIMLLVSQSSVLNGLKILAVKYASCMESARTEHYPLLYL